MINKNEIRFFGMQRSGNHAIINWIIRQTKGSLYFLHAVGLARYNSQNPYQAMEEFEHWASGVQVARLTFYDNEDTAAATQTIYYEDILGRFSKKEYLLYTYEDRSITEILSENNEKYHDQWLGTSEQRYDMLLLRDPFNLFASRFMAREWLNGIQDTDKVKALWKQYAKEYLGITKILPNTRIVVNFNLWVESRSYRQILAESLGLHFTDEGLEEMPAHFPGSSFDGNNFNNRAQEMALNERWKFYQSDALYRAIFRDDELIELSNRIFGVIPGTDILME